MRRTYKYVGMTKDEAQRSPSAVLRAMSISNGRWTFCEVVTFEKEARMLCGILFCNLLIFFVSQIDREEKECRVQDPDFLISSIVIKKWQVKYYNSAKESICISTINQSP